jgi:hypothetical protein
MMRIRLWQGKWQVIRLKKYGYIEVIYNAKSEIDARNFIQTHA